MPNNSIYLKILKALKVELTDLFDQNFSKGAFFGKPWKPRHDGVRTHLNNSGKLRRSIRSDIKNTSIEFSSSEPYAGIHNYGGKIRVTPKMKKFFWAKYLESGQPYWKSMALKPAGSFVVIPQRQFIGDHPTLSKAIQQVIIDEAGKEADKIISNLK